MTGWSSQWWLSTNKMMAEAHSAVSSELEEAFS